MGLKKLLVLFVIFGILGFGFLVLANNTSSPSDDFIGTEITVQDVTRIITGFACWLIQIVFLIMVIFLIFAGIRFFRATKLVTDGGKTTEINEAKKNLQWVLVGILVILSANIIIATIAHALGSKYPQLPFQLQCNQAGLPVAK